MCLLKPSHVPRGLQDPTCPGRALTASGSNGPSFRLSCDFHPTAVGWWGSCKPHLILNTVIFKNLLGNAGDTRCAFDPWVGNIPWRRKWQPTPVLLTRKSCGRRSLVGYSPWGRKESDMTERLHSLNPLVFQKQELVSLLPHVIKPAKA